MSEKAMSELLACARRELAMRRQVYPRWVAQGHMAEEKAAHEIDCMESICRLLEIQLNQEWFELQP